MRLSGSLMQLSREGDCLVVPTVTGLELSGLFSSEFQLDYVAETEERQGELVVERVIYHQEAKILLARTMGTDTIPGTATIY